MNRKNLWVGLRYEDPDHHDALGRNEESDYLWFNTGVHPEDVVEAAEHPPKYEYSVTGKKRLKPGSRTTTLGTKVEINGTAVALFKVNGTFYAIQNICPHQGASLHLGDIEDIDGQICISCPRHHWPFSLENGSCIIMINRQAQLYPVRIKRQRDWSKILYVGFPAIAESLFSDDDF